MIWGIHQAEVIEWLKAYDGPRFQAVVCDPPYALLEIGKRFGKDVSSSDQEHQGGPDTPFGRLSSGFINHHGECLINRWKDGMKPFGDGAGQEFETEQMPDEFVDVWACVPECPVRQLDDRAGLTSITGERSARSRSEPSRSDGWLAKDHQGSEYPGDTGGPSRFFYTGKADPREKDKGLEFFFWERTDKGFTRITEDEWAKLPRKKRSRGNIHPTVKPVDLIRYIATLVLPPSQEGKPRRVLVPFSGSGSELIGCLYAGWDEAVGIEMDGDYNSMAKARMQAALGLFGGFDAKSDSPQSAPI